MNLKFDCLADSGAPFLCGFGRLSICPKQPAFKSQKEIQT